MNRDSNKMGYFNVVLSVKEAEMLLGSIGKDIIPNMDLVIRLNQSIHEERVKISDHIMAELDKV